MEAQVSCGLLQGQGLWVQYIWVPPGGGPSTRAGAAGVGGAGPPRRRGNNKHGRPGGLAPRAPAPAVALSLNIKSHWKI